MERVVKKWKKVGGFGTFPHFIRFFHNVFHRLTPLVMTLINTTTNSYYLLLLDLSTMGESL